MDKYIKWEDADKSSLEVLPSGKQIEHHITRQIVCSHPQVDKIWQWGGMMPSLGEDSISNHLEIMTKDGQRYSEKVTDEQIRNADFPKAEEWLQQLK